MQNDVIDMIEPTPEPKSFTCKLYVILLYAFLKGGTFLIALGVWYRYDYFFAIIAFLISYLIMGIVRSKLRNSAIPPAQQEYNYTDKAIAKWFLARRICFEA